MAIDAYGNTASTVTSTSTTSTTATTSSSKSSLGKEDFLQLLLTELEYQDPTSPMDTETILQQTSQLATLEASQNTNDALNTLSTALATSMQFSGISAIGKVADTGSNAVVLEQGSDVTFELYFPTDIAGGEYNILDSSGNVLRSVTIDAASKGVSQYTWDGTDGNGNTLDAGVYYIEAPYTATDGTKSTTRVGIYPIESIKFDSGTTYAKVGSGYVDFSQITEITEA
ncbi:MAG: flagellar hook capping FlgD N-terminal domain-containing protein [Sulfuricurvum sp.]